MTGVSDAMRHAHQPLVPFPTLYAWCPAQHCVQHEAKVQHEWVAYQHTHFFSKSQAKSAPALRLADRLEQTVWASAMVRSRTFSDTVGAWCIPCISFVQVMRTVSDAYCDACVLACVLRTLKHRACGRKQTGVRPPGMIM